MIVFLLCVLVVVVLFFFLALYAMFKISSTTDRTMDREPFFNASLPNR